MSLISRSSELLKSDIWDNDIAAHETLGAGTNGDKLDEFETCGYKCFIDRDLDTWTYCGYVQLPEKHLDYKKSYCYLSDEIKVHGGLTFGNDGLFGFDCQHTWDLSPYKMTMHTRDPEKFPVFGLMKTKPEMYHYWTYDEVKAEVISMAKQFKARGAF